MMTATGTSNATMLILLVNLERRPDRLAFMAAQLDALRLPFVRIDAIDSTSTDLGPATDKLSVPEHACSLSHRKAWLHFLETGRDRCLILEDDVILSPALKPFLDDPANLPASVSILRLETQFIRSRLGPGRQCRARGLKIHQLHSTHYGAAAYVVTRAFAQQAVRDLQDFAYPVDEVLFGAADDCFYPAAVHQLRPALCVQADHLADAQNAPFAQSDVDGQRRIRLDRMASDRQLPGRQPPPAKVRRTIAEKCLLEIKRWGRKAGAMKEKVHEFFNPRTWQDVPFAGPVHPVAAAAIHVPGGE